MEDRRASIYEVKPGSHKKEQSIPTAVFLRDTLKIVSELREAKFAIYDGKVKRAEMDMLDPKLRDELVNTKKCNYYKHIVDIYVSQPPMEIYSL